MNQEDGPRVRAFRLHHHFSQPFGGAQFGRMFPELVRFLLDQRHGGRPANLEQCVPPHGIERLHPAIEQHGQPAKGLPVESPFGSGQKERHHLRHKHRQQTPGNQFIQQIFHPTLRWRKKLNRCRLNCQINPRLTSTQATYGVSQPGLRTTCKMVPWLSVSKLAW